MSNHRLTARQLEQFGATGVLIVPQIVTPARVSELRKLALADLASNIGPAEYEADLHYPGAPASREAPGGTTVRRLLQAYARHPVFRDCASSPALVGPLRQLLRPELMLSQAHQNCVMTKKPRFRTFTDWPGHPLLVFQRPQLISVWLALGPRLPDNGCLSFLTEHAVEMSARGSTTGCSCVRTCRRIKR
jgi:phytanoyl-CoA hydroxylase